MDLYFVYLTIVVMAFAFAFFVAFCLTIIVLVSLLRGESKMAEEATRALARMSHDVLDVLKGILNRLL